MLTVDRQADRPRGTAAEQGVQEALFPCRMLLALSGYTTHRQHVSV